MPYPRERMGLSLRHMLQIQNKFPPSFHMWPTLSPVTSYFHHDADGTVAEWSSRNPKLLMSPWCILFLSLQPNQFLQLIIQLYTNTSFTEEILGRGHSFAFLKDINLYLYCNKHIIKKDVGNRNWNTLLSLWKIFANLQCSVNNK